MCTKYMNRPVLIAAPLALCTMLATTAWATPPVQSPEAGPLVRMSHDAVRLLDDVAQAQTALNNGNNSMAEQDITRAMMQRDRLAMTARNHQFAKIVPIYSEFEQSTTLNSMEAMRNNGKPVSPANQPVTVDDAKDGFTFVGLDLDKTKARLQSAKEAIQNNNDQAAKDTLNAVGSDLVVTTISADVPLLAVRENLNIAAQAMRTGHPHEATAALQEASGELVACAQAHPNHAGEINQLRGNIDQMLKNSSQDNAGNAATVNGWWNEVNGWMTMPTNS